MSAYAAIAAPQFAAIGFWGGIALLICGMAGIVWAVFHKDLAPMHDSNPTTTGLKVEHEGDGPTLEINHGSGSEGAVINAAPILGQDVLGAHVIKKGNGGALVLNAIPGGKGPSLVINVGPKP